MAKTTFRKRKNNKSIYKLLPNDGIVNETEGNKLLLYMENYNKELEKIMALLFQSQTEIYKKFLEPDFQRRYKEFIFDTLWTQKNKQPPINP